MSTKAAAAVFVSLALLGPPRGWAQPLQTFGDLPLRIDLDDRIEVDDRSATRTSGRLVHLTPDDLAIETGTGTKRFASDDVQRVAVRGHALRRGALVGAAAFAVLGVAATCVNEGGAGCAFIGLLAAPFGAGLGLAVGAFVPQATPVYRASAARTSSSAARAPGGASASLLESLALRVNLGDQLRIEDRSGVRTGGRLTHLTADDLTIQTASGERHFAREALRDVAVRRRSVRVPVLVGAGGGAILGALAACTGTEREECPDAPLLAGGAGAGVGLAVGALVRRTTSVYPDAERRTLVLPLVSRGAVGLRVSRSW